MRTLATWFFLSSLLLGPVACSDEDDAAPATPSAVRPPIPQVRPPLDVKKPPADATRTGSGLAYKKLVEKSAGAQPKASETALVHYTGWNQRTGATFFSSKGRGQPIALDIAHAAPGFAEALQLLRKGEKAMVWVPPSQGTAGPLVYEIEIVDIVDPPIMSRR